MATDIMQEIEKGRQIDDILDELVREMEKSKVSLDLQAGQIEQNQDLIDALQQENKVGALSQMQKSESLARSTVSTGRNIRAPGRIRNRI